VDRPSALQLLSPVHAAAIVLHEAGLDHDAIAYRLGMDVRSILTLLEIARAKLAVLEAATADEGQIR
jgi:DNA-directed RNA polymerase specialized sigma24 family protein